MKKSILWNVKTRPRLVSATIKTNLVSATLLICVISAISVISGLAQSPEKMSYQAVVRDASDNLVTNQSVGMQISILQGSAGGTAVYVETQTPTTNTNGLVTIEIGSGTVVTGDFTTIDWTNGPYFIKTETDPTGGTTYTITGTSQLLSVPYALHAKTAESVTGTITETDPVYGSSVASSITVADTANWNNHTIDTDTQLDSTGVAALGYVAGAHTVNTDTQLDSTDIANLGYVAGTISETDPIYGSSIASGITGTDTTNWNNHTVDTDTQLDSTGVATLGYVAGAHTVNTDTQLDSTGVAALGYVAGTHTVNTDTQLDSTGVATLGYVAGAHTIDTDTQLDSTGMATLGFVAGAHTDSTAIANMGFVTGSTYAVGDFALGGIVFWVDETGQHGLVCAKTDQSAGMRWYAGTYGYTRAYGDGPYSGEMNTSIIIASQVAIGDDGATYAAFVCAELQVTEGGKTYGDWYLPSKQELNLMYQNKATIDATATANGGTAFANVYYWSSTEYNNVSAWRQDFGTGPPSTNGKTDTPYVRSVRAF